MANSIERVARADERLAAAHRVLRTLDLLSRWSRYGDPNLVGSVALGLVVRRDIDLEIFADVPDIRDGFTIVSDLAELPGVSQVRYKDSRNEPTAGLYWKLVYDDVAEQTWTVDMWLYDRARRAAAATAMVEPIRAALTDETRDAILAIKEEAAAANSRAHGHWLYRAVLNEGIRTYHEYRAWLGDQDVWEQTSWRPA